jgi:flavodoxin
MNYQVVYFSRSGNSKRVAEKVAIKLGAPLIKIDDHKWWKGPIGYIRAGFYATVDKKVNITLSEPLKDDSICIVVSPLWAGDTAPAVRAFFETFPKEKSHLIVTSIGSTITKREQYRSVTDVVKRSENEDEVIDKLVLHIKGKN